MKKLFLFLASAALLLAGCAKEQIVGPREGGMTKVTFTANLDNGVVTKAADDGDGAASSVNRCIMEIYYGDDLYTRQYAPVSDKQATFTAQVVSNRTYTVAFWADKVDDATTPEGLAADKYYTTDTEGQGLQAITIKNTTYIGNDDARDAFYHVGTYTVAQAGSSFGTTEEPILLKRPFAQMNVITTDWDKVTPVATLAPEKVNVTLKNAPVKFNALTETASGSKDLVYETAVYTAPAALVSALANEKTLSMDYLFASADKAVIDIDWKALHGSDANVEHTFAAVPYQRNYRTNIKGNLLTTQGQWKVTVESEWTHNGTTVEGGEDPYLVNYYQAGSIAAANEALKTNNAVSIENPSDLDSDIVIPAEQDDKNVLIKISGASTGDIAVKKAEDGPASLAIESDSKTLDIDLPNTHVELNKGNFICVSAKTSTTTLVVGKDVEIQTLTINGGNAEIYGLVSNITRANGVKADWYADSRAKLIAGLDKSIAGESVVLASDIDLNNEEWSPVIIGKAITFDGDNHTIKNLKIEGDYPDSHYGLIGYLHSNGIIKNLTIDGAQVLPPVSKGQNSRGAALVGIARDGDIINCHVKNVTVKAYQKVGGLIGQYSLEAGGTSIVKDCSAENVTISENLTGEGVWGAGGLIGSLCFSSNGHNIDVVGCSVKGISIANSTTEAAPKQTAHAFIGTIRDDAEATATLTGNTVEQTTGLYTDMYTTDYFGWATNPESNPSHKCQIIVDGTPWTPNYPFQIAETGAKYATLGGALTAATAGQTVHILKAGEYTFPGNTQKAITVEGLDEKDSEGNYAVAINLQGVSGQNKNVTFKHLTFNLLQAEHPDRGFTHCENLTYNECVFTGEYWGYDSGMSTFNSCVFQNATNYNIWTYGGNITLNDCEFYSDHGKFVNVYAVGSTVHTIYANNCVFHNTGAAKKAAFNLKGGNTHGSVVMTECSVTGKFPNSSTVDGQAIFSDSGLYMFDDPEWSNDVYAKVDGVTYYPYFSMDAQGNYNVNSATGLHKAINHWNALTSTGEKTITVADGTYEVSDMLIQQRVRNKSLVIKAANEKQAVLKLNADTKTKIFFLVDGGNQISAPEYIKIDGLKFQIPENPTLALNGEVWIVYSTISTSDKYARAIMGDTYNSQYYMHNVTLQNCNVEGFVGQEISVFKSTTNSQNIVVDNCTINKVGYVYNGYFDEISLKNSIVTNTKTAINCNDPHGIITVTGCEISTYHDCCLRAGKSAEITNNTFDIKYTGTETEAAVIYFRGATGPFEAVITGNTFTKSADMKYDVFVKSNSGPWTINKGTSFETVIEKGKGEETIRQQ